MGKMELSKCEKEVMEILYSAEMELNLEEIKGTVNTRYKHEWKRQTVATFVDRLTKKGWLSKEKKGKCYYYKPARTKHELKIRPSYYAAVANAEYAKARLEELKRIQSGGWISCSEQPLKEDSYIVAWIPENLEVRCDRPHYYGIFDYENGDWNIDVPDSFKNIGIIMLAYRPLPEPYRSKGE